MAGTAYTPSGTARPPRKRQFPFGLVMLIFGLGLGFYSGVAATKRAMRGPDWIQHLFGLPPTPVAVAPVVTPTAPPVASTTPATAPTQPATAPPAAPPANTGTAAPEKPEHPSPPVAPAKTDSHDLVGRWEATDTLPSQDGSSLKVNTAYVFQSDNTGEFDSNGKKLYDFHWKPSGDDIVVTYDGEGPDPTQEWTVKLKWSLNEDHSLLTLVPQSGKDARSFLYGLGPGVYHRK